MAARPQIQCSTGPFWAFDLEVALDALAEAGFSFVELMITRDLRTQDSGLVARLTAERELAVAAIHAPFLVLTRSVWSTDPLAKIERGADMCAALGATTLIVHPPYLWEQGYARWLQYEAATFEKERGVIVAVETMYPRWVAGRPVRVHQWIDPQRLASRVPHVALDTSHIAMSRRDALHSFAALGDKLAHVHLSNNAGDGRDGHLELENGVVPIDRLLAEIVRSHYAGAVCLELSVRRFADRPAALVRTLKRNREYLEGGLTAGAPLEKGLP
jgi:sugar phosphate isomerase/epimerase